MDMSKSVEIKICDNIFVKSMHFVGKHQLVPQHSHNYAHLSMIAVGSVRVWRDEELLGDFVAPRGVMIEAHAKHQFLTLTDETLIYCIHNTDTDLVHEENALSDKALELARSTL